MRIYKELDDLGFFKWYCTQYGSLNYQEYDPIYDDLPLDNIIRTQLNACSFKFFADEYSIFPYTYTGNGKLFHYCMWVKKMNNQYHSNKLYLSDDEAQFECLVKLVDIIKNIPIFY
jgi:hypothetical protein